MLNWLKDLFKKEPVVIVGAIMGVITMLVAFFPDLISEEQQQAFEDMLWLLLPMLGLGTLAMRQSVYAPANVVAAKKGDLVVAGPAATLVSVKVGEQVMVKSFGDGPDDPFGH